MNATPGGCQPSWSQLSGFATRPGVVSRFSYGRGMAIDSNAPDEPATAESTDNAEQDRAATKESLTEKVQNLQTIPRADDAAQIATKRADDDKQDSSSRPA